MQCHYCCAQSDLRPYGPQGSMVCFKCAMATPEREAETERHFAAQINAITNDAVVICTEAGPFPAKHLAKKGTCDEQ
jgi:hypothetical protein